MKHNLDTGLTLQKTSSKGDRRKVRIPLELLFEVKPLDVKVTIREGLSWLFTFCKYRV